MALRIDRENDRSLLDRILAAAQELEQQLEELRTHSVVGTDGGWASLDASGRFHQRAAWRAFETIRGLGALALGRDVPARREGFLEQANVVASAIAHDDARRQFGTNHMSRFQDAKNSLAFMLATLQELPSSGHGMPIIIADTSALIEVAREHSNEGAASVDWDRLRGEWWSALVVIVPHVVKELDRLKYRQHGKVVGKRAQAVIAHLTNAMDCPRTMPAIPMTQTVQLEMLLTESPVEEFALFPSLDPTIGDHRILMSVLDAARRWPGDYVMVSTNDLSMKILARHLRIPTVSVVRQLQTAETR